MKINIIRDTNKKGKERIRGETIYMDTKFSFTVHKSSKPNYKYVLVVSIISPATGKIMQMTKKPRNDFEKKTKCRLSDVCDEEIGCNHSSDLEKLEKEKLRLENKLHRLHTGARLDELNVNASTYLQDANNKTIETHVVSLVKKLYGDHYDEILKELKKSPSTDELSVRTLYDMYQNDFFRTLPAVTPKVLKEKKAALVAFCNAIEKTISHLTDNDIKNALESLNKSHRKHTNTIEKFFSYIGNQKTYRGVNPITRYKNNTQTKNKGKHSPPSSNHLTQSEDKELHNFIVSQLELDDRCLAIPLAKGYKMPINRIIRSTWDDVIIIGDEVLIREYQDKFAGGTNNYLRPPLRETANFIIARYQYLKKTKSKIQLKKCPLVPLQGKSETEKKAELSKYFRETLQSVGVTRKKLTESINPENPKAGGGAGYALLSNHYEYVLQEVCGVDLNSGVGYFLRAMRIHDTTTDYYRCLTDETGNHFLEIIMRRDGYAEIKIDGNPATIKSTLSEDKTTRLANILPCNANEITGVLTRKKLFLPAGSDLILSAENGIRGAARLTEKEDVSPEADYIVLY